MTGFPVVTGLGLVSPLGIGREAFRAGLAAGRSAHRTVERKPGEDGASFAATAPAVSMCEAPVEGFDLGEHVQAKGLRRASTHVGFGLAATAQALEEANSRTLPERRGLAFSSSLGSARFSYQMWHGILSQGPTGASPSLFSEGVPNALSGHVARTFQLLGPGHMLGGGSDCGLRSMMVAADVVMAGRMDLMVAGAAEERTELASRAYRRFGLARRAGTSRGMVLSEGAAAAVIEREEDVCRDGRATLARVAVARSIQIQDLRERRGATRLRELVSDVLDRAGTSGEPMWWASSANGTRLDAIEAAALAPVQARLEKGSTRVKQLAGEALSVSPLFQVAEALDVVAAGRPAMVLAVSLYGAATAVVLAPCASS